MTRLLFVILNYKTWQDTARVTEEILNEFFSDTNILIVDNCSPNDSFKQLQKLSSQSIEVICAPENGGYAKGNNYGLRYAEKYNPEYVCVINNDVHFNKNTVDTLIEYIQCIPDLGMIAPIQVLPNNIIAPLKTLKVNSFFDDLCTYIAPRLSHKHIYQENTKYKGVQKVGILPGAFLLAKYEVLKSIDFFDESTFLFCEERFISQKLKTVGKFNYIALDQYYVHEHSKTINSTTSVIQQNRILLNSRLKFTRKYRHFSKVKCFILKICYAVFELRLRTK